MSSSVFIDNTTTTKRVGREFLDKQNFVGSEVKDESNVANSNLVVVYGKNGINFDRRGLENLIEEKTLSSISVIRLTSPTPSMEEEEEEADKLREIKRKQDIMRSDGENVMDNSDAALSAESDKKLQDLDSNTEERSDTSSSSLNKYNDDDDDDDETDEDSNEETIVRHRKKKHLHKTRKTHTKFEGSGNTKTHKEYPEIVGLTVEEFYPPEDAKEMAKEILKLAGISTIKRTADYEFQLYVIKNDHCYTPFTSPAQMKAKMEADKVDAEKAKQVVRKLVPMKEFIAKKTTPTATVKADVEKSAALIKKLSLDKNENRLKIRIEKVISQGTISNKIDDEMSEQLEDDYDLITSASEEDEGNNNEGMEEVDPEVEEREEEDEEDDAFEESDFTMSEISADSQNDRDSDLDFDVNNRKGRKRAKVQNVKSLKCNMNIRGVAGHAKRNQMSSHEQRNEALKLTYVAGGTSTPRSSDVSDYATRVPVKRSGTPPLKMTKNLAARKVMPSSSIHQSSATIAVTKMQIETANPVSTQQTTLTAAVRCGPIVQVIASPKGGFTNIGALLSEPDIDIEQISAPPSPTSSPSTRSAQQTQKTTTPTSKGFMPLGIETAAKNQLPSQISIQTHQSSSELAAEHDKQLDLIDSIVKDEMEKTSTLIVNAPAENENIPELVKMLESTERALETNHTTPQITNFRSSSNQLENDIDISNAPLLDTPDDELPADLLQHVVELIEDDKTLQAAVEKEVFGETHISVESAMKTTTTTSTTSITPIASMFGTQRDAENKPIHNRPQVLPELQTKSIIQATLFSDATPASCSTPSTLLTPGIASKTVPSATLKKEPIKIVRGNGRVITLPPIEAPTTRAKRRAQTQPTSKANTSFTDSESHDTSFQSNTSLPPDSSIFTNSSSARMELKTTEATTKRGRASKDGGSGSATTKSAKKSATKRSTAGKAITKHVAAEDTNEAQDDDDPRKLWCICRQPHNNRFMICCDVCGDWFHGTCVSITKAMGLEMEQKGTDWTCPRCVKKLVDKKQRKITDMLEVKTATTLQQSSAKALNTYDALNASNNNNTTSKNQLKNATDSSAAKLETPKKQHIEIEKIQSGEFISLKQLEENKLPLTVLTSGQKKQFPPLNTTATTTPPQTTTKTSSRTSSATTNQTLPNRVIVVQKMGAATKKAFKSPSPQQQIKLQKVASNSAANKSLTDRASTEEEIPQNDEPTTPCIVCKKPSRPNSIYCSDDCIRKHAQNALNSFTVKPVESPTINVFTKFGTDDKKKKSKSLFEDLLSMADRKPKVERVNVFERKSGRFLIGNNAPTTANLKKWLQDNPTFEVVQPGSSQAIEIEKRQKQRITIKTTTSPSLTHSGTIENIPITKKGAVPSQPQITESQEPKESIVMTTQSKIIKQTVEQTKPSLNSPKVVLKSPQQLLTLKSDKPQINKSDAKDETKPKDKNASKRQTSENNSKKTTAQASGGGNEICGSTNDSEPIRLNVRRTLMEQLSYRINESVGIHSDQRPSNEYIEQFAQQTELEMYNFFNRDTGIKYKAKYRSLMFNIKDRKNQTLFQKISAKVITPHQLVRMSPEELASQELAQWRENEVKHQLEMIKKSELDLLSCTKNYVLKTHKGEEVIEAKSRDCVNLDITIPVEDVVSVLNHSTVTGNSKMENATAGRKDYCFSEFSTSKETAADVSKSKDKERGREKERTHKSNKDRHREKSKSKRRSRSRSRSREKRNKGSSRKDGKQEKEERERERDHFREREHRERSKDDSEKRIADKKSISGSLHSPLTVKPNTPTLKEKHRDMTISSTQPKKDITTSTATTTAKPIEAFSLIDQIIESTKTVEEAANLVSEKTKTENITATTQSTANSNLNIPAVVTASVQFISQNSTDSDQEPTSTVSIVSSPPDPYIHYYNTDAPLSLWSGNINMIDVASFQILIQSVYGNVINLGKLLPDELDVVGRIGPDTVWDYISKIKKSPNKEIVVLRLLPTSDTETVAYTILYKYLFKRNRLGVIKTHSSQIKDFYIFPLGAGNQMPAVLQMPERVEFYEDPYKPDILVGILIRVIGGKRLSAAAAAAAQQQTTVKTTKLQSKSKTVDTFTPPVSPKRKRLSSITPKDDVIDIDAIIKAPVVSKKSMPPSVPTSTTVDDQDEPYSPGCSSDEDLTLLTAKPTDFHKNAEEELKRKMDDLNRQIAAQEKEIAGLLNVEPSKYMSASGTGGGGGGGGSSNILNPLASISIPSNLSQILASIKNKAEAPTTITAASHISATPSTPLTSSVQYRSDADEEYTPEPAINFQNTDNVNRSEKFAAPTSRLAQLSEAELLSMVPDDMLNATALTSSQPSTVKKPRYEEPPPPGV